MGQLAGWDLNRSWPLLQAVRLGSAAIAEICTAIEGWAASIGAPKRTARINLHLELDERIEVLQHPNNSSEVTIGLLVSILSRPRRSSSLSHVECMLSGFCCLQIAVPCDADACHLHGNGTCARRR